MNYVNNWQRPITLNAEALTCALDLPDGLYRLTLADAYFGATRWEIVDATVVSGAAALTRAQEGTAAHAWPPGSVIYAALTAGLLMALQPGAQVVLGEDYPAAAPPAGGALYVMPSGPAFVALGAEHPEQWAQLIGDCVRHDFSAAMPASDSGVTSRSVRAARVRPDADADPGPRILTLHLPDWPVLPRGFYIDVLASVASPITLHINPAAALPPGAVLSHVSGADLDSGASVLLTEGVLTLVAAHPVRFGLRDLYVSEGSGAATVELSRLPYAALSYISLSQA
ncbi:MAG: hypothetical protein Q8R10_19645 [Pseudomonas sp.]|uniref:hypothetical protein n=1 Tax=Pseudomonas sp. TaxID=306 RepID=UPI0027325810|nr:hypothetical protein [Pseudomonas sp.]MDP3848639.1 hypothetical protein [Pseudomonas sp.]